MGYPTIMVHSIAMIYRTLMYYDTLLFCPKGLSYNYGAFYEDDP